MDEWRTDEGGSVAAEPPGAAIRRARWTRLVALVGLALVLLLLVALAALWMARRPIASNILQREFERRGVQASYRLDRVGLRTQQVSNLVIGDPKRPDLAARVAQVQIRIKWNGSVEVYRIVARGVRLRGRLVGGRVSWGQIDRLMPPPSDKPFELPDFVVDVADTSISLATPFGPLGFAVQGRGNLSGGFKGLLAARSPRLDPGRCEAHDMRVLAKVEVVARRPHFDGPLTLSRFACPASRLEVTAPRLELDSRFNEAFTRFDGRGRMAMRTLVAGANGLANFVGNVTFSGNPDATYGEVELSAQQSRMATIYAERTRLKGRYRLGMTGGTMVLVANYDANRATLHPSMLASVTGALEATDGTPIEPVATSIGNALKRTAGNFDASGELRLVNFPGGGAARIESANVTAPNGARARVSGGDGVTYYWPSGRLRIDGLIEMAGGGLPQGRVLLRQPRSGAPMSGVAQFAPYQVGQSRIELAPIRFAAQSDGSTAVNTAILLDGPFEQGRVRALRLPLTGRFGGRSGLAVGTSCAEVSWTFLQFRSVQFDRTRLPVCPVGPAIVSQAPNGQTRWGALVRSPRLSGRIGQSPLQVAAAQARVVGREFAFSQLKTRLGRSASPLAFDAGMLRGTFAGSGINGSFADARSTIGNVPLLLSDANGRWRLHNSDLTVDAGLTVSDRNPDPRFYPLRGEGIRLTMDDFQEVRATGTLAHPGTGTKVTDVSIRHDIGSGAGHALLDVPGLTFGENLQPEQLTRLTEGVVALVSGTVRGQGRINWSSAGEVTSSGDFSTDGLDLAAPFGPVAGMRGSIHFDDLLGLTTPPGQTMSIASINPGILVENGVIRYQLLPGQLVKIERGEWPFMGGRLVLRETILNFSRPTAKRLTFEIHGLDAKIFVDTLGFSGIQATGIFDGVLPMIFDENGGRIVGGRLDSRPPGGRLQYTGAINRANLGLAAGFAFDALRDLRFKSMIIRLDGELAGEFATRLTIDGVGLGQTRAAQFLRAVYNLPLRFNVSIRGPFRALIATAKSFSDPRTIINDVLPRPLEDVPGIVTEVRRREEDKDMTQTPPAEQVTTTPPPTPSER